MRGAFGGIPMKEEYIVFYHNEKELAAYTVRGTFAGELDATKELLAYENGIAVQDIKTVHEMRK